MTKEQWKILLAQMRTPEGVSFDNINNLSNVLYALHKQGIDWASGAYAHDPYKVHMLNKVIMSNNCIKLVIPTHLGRDCICYEKIFSHTVPFRFLMSGILFHY